MKESVTKTTLTFFEVFGLSKDSNYPEIKTSLFIEPVKHCESSNCFSELIKSTEEGFLTNEVFYLSINSKKTLFDKIISIF